MQNLSKQTCEEFYVPVGRNFFLNRRNVFLLSRQFGTFPIPISRFAAKVGYEKLYWLRYRKEITCQ